MINFPFNNHNDAYNWYQLYLSGKVLYKSSIVQLKTVASLSLLTHCGLVMPYGDLDLGQHRLR